MAETETATLGGGCFWCLEAAYQEIKGVVRVESGFAGGQTDNPSYEAVAGGQTGHAEVVQVTFNPEIITYPEILDIFWAVHDPTTLNRQGNDVGTQYRSVIFYTGTTQRQSAEASRRTVSKLWPNPIVTAIEPLTKFYPAETEHQNYFRNHPERAYCQIVINPKLAHLRKQFQAKLK